MWLGVLMGVGFFFGFRLFSLRVRLYEILVCGLMSGYSFSKLQRHRRKLYAMLLNKPRDISSLTQWTEHPFAGWAVEQWQFFCACGRLVDLGTASYFKSTKRFSLVCECGRGHFLLWPKVPPARTPEIADLFKGKR